MNLTLKKVNSSSVQIIARNIRRLMSLHKISESKFAKDLGISVMTVRRIISGETEDPRISTLSLISDYFNINIDSLLKEDDIPIEMLGKNKPIFVPIFNWDMLNNKSFENINLKEWKNWHPIINNNYLDLNKQSFALETKKSMQTRFPEKTLLVINPDSTPTDNDLVLVKTLKTNELSLRELIIDSPKWILQPIVLGSELFLYNMKEHTILGVVVLTLFQTRN